CIASDVHRQKDNRRSRKCLWADERPPQFNEGQGPPNKDGQNPPPRRMRSSLTLFTNQQPGADNQHHAEKALFNLSINLKQTRQMKFMLRL
ncbi:hypothetical protein TNCT_324321, partial [Trichonephila clavata]